MRMGLRIVCISDTHARHQELAMPAGDILVHGGDLTRLGEEEDIVEFDRWLGTLPYRHRLVIAGNHDFLFEQAPERARRLITNAIYLQDEGVAIEGLRFWGSPWQPWFYDWAFNLPRGEALAVKWRLIPPGTDVLATHGPPMGIGDRTILGEHVGCADLLAAVQRLEPRLHVFGHIHEGYGLTRLGETIFVNACSCDIAYRPVNPPIVVEI
jgi:predicted phosphodiesterase